jgi:hypothetical protein
MKKAQKKPQNPSIFFKKTQRLKWHMIQSSQIHYFSTFGDWLLHRGV